MMLTKRQFLIATGASTMSAAIAAALVASRRVDDGLATDIWPKQVNLSFDVAKNEQFSKDIASALRVVENNLAGKLLVPLLPESLVDPASERRALVHALVVRDGQLQAIFTNHMPSLDVPLSKGSISKVFGVLSLEDLAPHLMKADSKWCSQPAFGFQDADGSHGSRPPAWLPAYEAVGRSKNLALLWALRQVDQKALRETLTDAGLQTDSDYMPAISIALGHLQLSAWQVVEMMDAIASGKARRAAIRLDANAPPSALALWAAQVVVARHGSGERVRRLLSAPVRHPFGTARHLRSSFLPSDQVFSKTGTATNGYRYDTGKVFCASVIRAGRTWTCFAEIHSPRPSLPLGRRISTTALAPFHRAVLAQINKES